MRLLHQLHSANQIGDSLFLQRLNGHGDKITLRQAVLLDAIKEHPGGNQTILCEATGIDRSTLADIAKRVVAKGWITRRRTKEDTRAYAVQLTAEGRRMLGIAQSAAKKAEADLLIRMPSIRGLAA